MASLPFGLSLIASVLSLFILFLLGIGIILYRTKAKKKSKNSPKRTKSQERQSSPGGDESNSQQRRRARN